MKAKMKNEKRLHWRTVEADANNLENEKIHFKRDKQERQPKFSNKRTLLFQFMRVISDESKALQTRARKKRKPAVVG